RKGTARGWGREPFPEDRCDHVLPRAAAAADNPIPCHLGWIRCGFPPSLLRVTRARALWAWPSRRCTLRSAMDRVVFLAGLGRSGTTLLERALAELPGVQALGEVNHLWRRSLVDDELCGCGEPFSRCPHWRAVGDRAFGGWDNVDVSAVEAAQSEAMRLRHIAGLARSRSAPSRAADLVADHHRRI